MEPLSILAGAEAIQNRVSDWKMRFSRALNRGLRLVGVTWAHEE
jgi:hypothetical protein